MKTFIQRIARTVVLMAFFAATAKAQDTSIAQEELIAQPINWNQLPASGTFWLETPNGLTPPYPCRPQYMAGASAYALSDDSFVVDARKVKNFALVSMSSTSTSLAPPPPTGGGHTNQVPKVNTLIVTSNRWFNQIVISNHTYVSLSANVLDGMDGSVRTTQLPAGTMFPITATNLTIPLSRWTPVGITNSIENSTFEIPYNAALKPISFYKICAHTNGDLIAIPPYTLMLTNFGIQPDAGVTVSWTNNQHGLASEFDTIVENDTNGHSYLVGTTTTTGKSNSFSFELTVATNLQFVRYALPAPLTADQFFLTTSNFNTPDVVTIPYVANTNSGRVIMDVSVYDVTDPNNEQLLAEVDGTNCNQGTLEIPGISIKQGVEMFEFRVSDDRFSDTITDITITNHREISIVAPFLAFEANGTNRIAASSGGYGVAFHLATTDTNGTWDIKQFKPDGTLYNELQAAVTNIGQNVIYDDGSTPNTVFPDPYYDFTISVLPNSSKANKLSNPPAPVGTKTFRVWLIPPRSHTGSIVGYDDTLLPSNSSDRQTILGVMQDGESSMSDFVCYPIDIQDGNYVVSQNPVAVDLNQPTGWNWTALQAMLSGSSYHHYDTSSGWTWQNVGLPINFVAVEAHGAVISEDANSAFGLQGPSSFKYSQVTQFSLRDWGFDRKTNAVAIAIFTGCRLGDGPFVRYILRDNGLWHQISQATATAQHIRPCFGLGWTTDTVAGDLDQWTWVSYFTLFASEVGGSGSSPFAYTLDGAVSQANFYWPAGSDGVIWSGTQGMTLDQAAY